EGSSGGSDESGGSGGGGAGLGGAIFIRAGSLTLNNTTFNNNSATGGTGGNNGKGKGGAIFAVTSALASQAGVPTAPTVTANALPGFSGNTAAQNAGNSNAANTFVDSADFYGTITVTTPNTAPSFTGNATLAAVNEDAANPGGATITSLFGSLFNDPGGTLAGIAVVGNAANTLTEGRWQYSTDGTNWFDIATNISDSSALAVSASTSVRFLPALNYNGTPPALTVRAIDNTYSGGFTSGSTAVSINATTNGETTPIAASTNTLGTSITPVNDAPVNILPSRSQPISIPDFGGTSPYPAPITVSGVTGNITNLTVTLNNVSHTFPDDIDILLVGPGGQNVLLMSDAGGNADLNNVTLTFDDSAAAFLPNSSQITAGTYKPTDFETGDTFNAPAPAGPYGTALSAFNGSDPNGTWNLYVVDDFGGDSGSIAGGWSLNLTTGSNTTNEDTSLVFSSANNNQISVSDVDSAAVTVNLSITNGTLSFNGLVGTGNGTSNLSYTGTLADVNAALNGLTYAPTANFNGNSVLTITSNDGTLTDTDTVNITVNPVNDEPSFTPGANQTVTANAGQKTVTNWATGFNPGPADEASQTALAYNIVGNTNPGILTQIAIDPATGALTYTPVSSIATPETTTISVQVQDSGGTTNGGDDTSQIQTFTITVNPIPNVSINDISVSEASNAEFAITLDRASSETVTVNYTTANGTATAGSDYTDTTNTVTFNPGEISKNISIPVTNDSLDEENETFNVTLSSATNANITDNQGVATINDDDNPPTISISNTSLTEGTGGTTNAVFTVNLSAASGQAVTVDYATAGSTAVEGDDYSLTTGTITFDPGDITKTVTVSVIGDSLDEFDETFRLNLTNPTNATLSTNGAEATIVDNDNPPNISIASTAAVGELDRTAIVQVSLDAPSGKTVTVNYNTSNGSANAPGDYTAASGTLTFNPGETSKLIQVNVNSDNISENNETFNVTLSNANNANITNATGVVTISDGDLPPLVVVNDIEIAEGTGGTTNAIFTVNLLGNSEQTVTVNYNTSNGTAIAGSDYTATTGNLTFNPGQTRKTITVPINTDSLDEFDETFNVNLTSATNAIILDNFGGIATINDDDAPPTVSINDLTFVEGTGGTTNAVFTLTLSAASGKPITVNYKTVDDNATSPADFTAANTSVTFNPGEITKTVTVPINPDSIDEINETFSVELTSGTNVTIADDQGFATIIDDDNPPTISIGDITLQEGTGGTREAVLTVNLSSVSGKQITVNYNTANGTAIGGNDYTNLEGTLTFNPGDISKQIRIAVNPDASFEPDETFTVNLSQPTNATIADNQAIVTLTNDDNIPQISINDVTLSEGTGGTRNAEFTISLSAPSTQTVTVNYATSNGSAIAPEDYTAVTATGITFNPGETSKTISVAINTDSIQETTETFTVNLTGATNAAIADNQGVATINDDDNPVSISISDVSVTEGTGGTTNAVVTVSLSGISGLPVTVNYATSDGTANAGSDYTAIASSLTFNPGETSKTITVAINPDTLQEPLETFNVSLTGATNATIADNTGIVSIIDDDRPTQVDEDCFCDNLVRPNIDSISGLDNAPNFVTAANSGSDLDDTLIGTNANDQLNGFGGNDWIFGLQGNDNILGGTENDTIYGGQGRDWILGEAGNDWIKGDFGGDWINSGLGNDTVYGGQGNDFGRGGKNDDLMFGDNGDDTFGGDKGNDTLYGGADNGRDLLFGGGENDLLLGNQGNDTLVGDEGNDTVRGGQNDDIGFGDAGDDVLYGDRGNDSLCGDDGNDTLYGGNGSSIPIVDNGEQDWLCGGKGNDLLFGNEGRDNLNGSEGDDTLYGGKDDDIITGGAGSDRLFGDLGQDQLRGGEGSDFFALTRSTGTDVILDFTDGEDLLALRGGLTFAQLNLIDSNGSALIGVQSSGEILAILPGVQASLLGQQDFISFV
ncbi:MAG TPA: hypothetical protein DCZ55_02685, partial [Cyanobacteria bacterium UBA11371]|nr:hypothetical protein [Cyanobacteria bacterium UBA11371]